MNYDSYENPLYVKKKKNTWLYGRVYRVENTFSKIKILSPQPKLWQKYKEIWTRDREKHDFNFF